MALVDGSLPVITVVTVSRNDLAGMQRTLNCLRCQTYPAVQHVVVDGASTDGTAEWARRHPAFPDSTVLSEPDEGIFQAMNKGLALTRGEVVCFLNSGDTFASADVLALVADGFRERGWQWAYGRGQMIDADGRPVRAASGRGYSLRRLMYWHYDICHQATFMRAEFICALGGFDEHMRVAADYRLAVAAGLQAAPERYHQLFTLTLAGGVSHRHPWVAQREAHLARTSLLKLTGPRARLDLLWAWVLTARTYARRFGRRLANRANRGAAARRPRGQEGGGSGRSGRRSPRTSR